MHLVLLATSDKLRDIVKEASSKIYRPSKAERELTHRARALPAPHPSSRESRSENGGEHVSSPDGTSSAVLLQEGKGLCIQLASHAQWTMLNQTGQ